MLRIGIEFTTKENPEYDYVEFKDFENNKSARKQAIDWIQEHECKTAQISVTDLSFGDFISWESNILENPCFDVKDWLLANCADTIEDMKEEGDEG